MENNEAKRPTLRELREKKPAKKEVKNDWFHRHMGFLFNPMSVFYYALAMFLLGALWAAYALYNNSNTQLLNWDYTWQYIPFTYTYWDAWHTFFTTGHFPLYDGNIFLGTDMIGSGSYYGLFDPFMFICYLLPRSWIPHTYAYMTFAKIMVGALGMRAYLKYMGIKEWTARFGGIIYALSGYTTFFMGSPNFTSAMAFFPFILLGIEKVISEQKVVCLSISIFLLGISCFFYVPVFCIYGVIYALWRFFFTLKRRNKKQQFATMFLGVAGFAIGLLLASFSFLPSMRETLLSGRSASIGTAYWHSVKDAMKSFDFRSLFTLVFEEVGDNPGREMMGMISFFFPAGGWTNLPFERGGYDAWTSSLFCYTPGVILFFTALIHSIRLKKWNHLLVIALCIFAVFTNFSYFFFYAFSGNGYGRWYLVLVPLIVYYCCWGFDQRKNGPAFIPLAGAVMGLAGTIITYVLVQNLIAGHTFTSRDYNVHNTTYWQSSYYTPEIAYNGVTAAWYFYYQIALVVIEGAIFFIGHKRKWLPYVVCGFVCAEAIVMGNASYAFNSTWSYKSSFTAGESNRESSLVMANNINANDKSFFRSYSDTCRGSSYFHNVFALKLPSTFHSLMNFDVESFALINQMKRAGSSATTYGGETYYNPKWSGFYSNKRYATDTLLGYRYYIIENNYAAWKDPEGNPIFLQPNIPFECEEMVSYSPNRERYRVYRRSEESVPQLGYAVDSSMLYRIGVREDSFYANDFFLQEGSGVSRFNELQWAQYVELNGAIIEDDTVLPESIPEPKKGTGARGDAFIYEQTGMRRLALYNGLTMDYYQTAQNDGLFPSSKQPYKDEGLAYFLNHYASVKTNVTSDVSMAKDLGKLVIRPTAGTYFNADPTGCYFDLRFYNSKSSGAPRIYALGDTFDDQGNLLEENVCLGFDNYLLPNATNSDYYSWDACTYGLYATGRVKQIVFCFGGNGTVNVSPSNVYTVVHERSELKSGEAKRLSDALQNVKTQVNSFTFDTSYAEDRVVVTQLGYDRGWSVKATLPDGTNVDCQTMRLDGGLVGFVAPHAVDEHGDALTIHYVMEYKTPYGNLSAVAWVLGAMSLSGIVITQFYLGYRKKKKQAAALLQD